MNPLGHGLNMPTFPPVTRNHHGAGQRWMPLPGVGGGGPGRRAFIVGVVHPVDRVPWRASQLTIACRRIIVRLAMADHWHRSAGQVTALWAR